MPNEIKQPKSAQLYRVNGIVSEIYPMNDRDFNLAELYRHLECNIIEVVQLPGTGKIMIIDEEGKLKPHEQNSRATHIARLALGIEQDDYIAGNAIVCDKSMLK